MGGRIIARGLGLGVVAMLLNVLVAFAWVFFYSVALAPGHDGAFYQAYAQRVAPISGLLAGVPIFVAAGWLAARGPGAERAALLPAASYIVLDLLLLSITGLWTAMWLLALSYITKAAAAFAGGGLVKRQRLLQ
jgi:hypothetical protein